MVYYKPPERPANHEDISTPWPFHQFFQIQYTKPISARSPVHPTETMKRLPRPTKYSLRSRAQSGGARKKEHLLQQQQQQPSASAAATAAAAAAADVDNIDKTTWKNAGYWCCF